jgi:hypothetical protein
MKNTSYDPTTHYVDENAGRGNGGIFAWRDAEVTNDVATYRAWHNEQLNTTGITWPLGTAPSYSDLLAMVAEAHDRLKEAQAIIAGDTTVTRTVITDNLGYVVNTTETTVTKGGAK